MILASDRQISLNFTKMYTNKTQTVQFLSSSASLFHYYTKNKQQQKPSVSCFGDTIQKKSAVKATGY